MRQHTNQPVGLPYVDERDILLLAADLGVGYFPAGGLYAWYTATIQADGREPVSKKAFGMALRKAGLHPAVRAIDGKTVRCWLISRPWYHRGNEMLDKERAAEVSNAARPVSSGA